MTNSSIYAAFERMWQYILIKFNNYAAKTDVNNAVNNAVKKAAPRNLLDNSDFTNMVNQKGASSYTGSISAYDRWRTSRMTVSATKDGLSVVPDSQTGLRYLYQRVAKNLSGKKVTVAIDGMPVGGYIKITDYQLKNFISASEPTQSGLNVLSAEIPTGNDDGIAVVFYIPDDSSSIFKWATLYEGEYTIDTLPEYHPKGYETELLICRQYDAETGEYIGLRKFSQPVNLLDNSDFTNAVDQRGWSTDLAPVYNTDSTYCIDRWIMRGTGGVYPSAIGINITKNGFSGITQPIDNAEVARIAGKTVTFAAMIKEATGDYTMLLHSGTKATYIGTAYGMTTFSGTGLKLITVTLPEKFVNDYLGCFIGQGNEGVNGDELIIEWCALYEGAYTAETLPKYQPKGYVAEMLKCQRYFLALFGNGTYEYGYAGQAYSKKAVICPIPLRVPMRITPTVSTTGTIAVTTATGSNVEATVSGVQRITNTYIGLNITCNSDSLVAGNATILSATDNAGRIYLSADL